MGLSACGARNNAHEVAFQEADLSQPGRSGHFWYELGGTGEPRSDLSEILGQPFSSKEEAVELANRILISESRSEREKGQGIIGDLRLQLFSVTHDPAQNIWLFTYIDMNPELLSASFRVALDGNSGELLRMWVE